jgi:hypothetical protein
VKQITSVGFSCRQERILDFGIGKRRGWHGRVMDQQLRARHSRSSDFRSEAGGRLWLSMLVGAMEEASRAEIRSLPCDPSSLIGLRAQLARPASPYPYGASRFSLRN